MEPNVPDGSYCLFRSPVEGSRNGKSVLVRLRDEVDQETGERFSVKRYSSRKVQTEEGPWRHLEITLSPLNREYEPIVLVGDQEGKLDVVAELLEVLKT